jgi:hypothetical protein
MTSQMGQLGRVITTLPIRVPRWQEDIQPHLHKPHLTRDARLPGQWEGLGPIGVCVCAPIHQLFDGAVAL